MSIKSKINKQMLIHQSIVADNKISLLNDIKLKLINLYPMEYVMINNKFEEVINHKIKNQIKFINEEIDNRIKQIKQYYEY